LVSRAVNNHQHYQKWLGEFGFNDVTVTALEKDALYSLVRKMKPTLMIMGARFYQSCTPFLMGEMHKTFPDLKMASVCIGEYPPDLAMYFILNGIKSYVNSFEGVDQFYKGIHKMSNGGDYVSPAVIKRIDLRPELPKAAGNITDRHKEIIRLICCGFRDLEIGDTLQISRKTVGIHKRDIFTSLNVRSAIELLCVALTLKIISLDDLYFYPNDYSLNPQPTVEKPYFIRREK
jgi:DNA-binding NarL/FixJ family response regulator